jgi:methionyl-tRNA formyltransferase
MKVAFRVDSSLQIGTGHLARTLRIARWMQKRSVECFFICRELNGASHQVVLDSGFQLIELAAPTAASKPEIKLDLEHSAWLEVPWEQDAAETKAQLEKRFSGSLDLLVLDHYALDARWLNVVGFAARRLMAIDDICDRKLPVDLLMNPSAPLAEVMAAGPKSGAGVMAGPAFTLIPEELRRTRRVRGLNPEIRILLFLGGIDPFKLTEKIIAELVPLLNENCSLDVVIGEINPHKQELLRKWDGKNFLRLHLQPSNYLELVQQADLAIGAAGTAAWERAAAGLPAILVNFASNQNRVGMNLGESGAALNLGQYTEIAPGRVAAEVKKLLVDRKAIAELSRRGMEFLDGYGLERVGQAILGILPKVVIATDESSWINDFIPEFIEQQQRAGFHISWNHDVDKSEHAEVLCLISYGKIVSPEQLSRFQNSIVVHESDLPIGRGWSPMTWQVLEGKRKIPICLLEASERVDAGLVYLRSEILLSGTELVADLRKKQASATFQLLRDFLTRYPFSVSEGKVQKGEPSYYPRRKPVDSKIDPNKTIRELFPLLQVVDNERYPAYFELNGKRFLLKIEADEREEKK